MPIIWVAYVVILPYPKSSDSGVFGKNPFDKSGLDGGVSIVDAFASIDKEEAYIMEMNIEPYKYSDNSDYNPKSQRKLLLHKGEIKKLIGLLSQKGYTLIATKVFEKNGYIKIQLALAKGKKDYDKRKKILNKEHAKEIKNY